MEEVSHIFKYKSIKEFTEKKNYITELYNQIESEYNKIDQDIKNGDSSKVVKRRKHLENWESALSLWITECQYYKSKLCKNNPL